MGGLGKKLPGLAAVLRRRRASRSPARPGPPGFFSSDAILAAVYRATRVRPSASRGSCSLATAMLTAFYTTRLVLIVFFNPPARITTNERAPRDPQARPADDGAAGDPRGRVAARRAARPSARGVPEAGLEAVEAHEIPSSAPAQAAPPQRRRVDRHVRDRRRAPRRSSIYSASHRAWLQRWTEDGGASGSTSWSRTSSTSTRSTSTW